MKPKDVNNLLFNPQWTSKLLHYFISGTKNTKNQGLKFEIIYYVLPFIFDDVIFNKLVGANSKSTINTLFKSAELKNRLIPINKRVEAFKIITNQAIIYLGNKNNLTLGSFIELDKTIHYRNEDNAIIKKYVKAAYNLGVIISKENYIIFFTKINIESK